jgi:RNA polymerase sigma-70 factor, ECF subfamily
MSTEILTYMLEVTSGQNTEGEISDEELLALSRSKPWLFAQLVDRYQAAFVRKVSGILRDQRDVEEVVLDTFTKIYINADRFSPQEGAKFSSWAYRVLLNTAFTRYQKLAKAGQRFTSLDPEFEELVADSQTFGVVIEKTDAVERILVRLPGHLAHVLRLHYVERWSQEDIAGLSGESVGTIKARIHRAKAAFRRETKEGEVEW